ncbi:MAG: hypothetical protein LBK66_11020 [Spirochaetaceae bacterium]|nr:hypothetical protein [Spirochaetaceae bacterium]
MDDLSKLTMVITNRWDVYPSLRRPGHELDKVIESRADGAILRGSKGWPFLFAARDKEPPIAQD